MLLKLFTQLHGPSLRWSPASTMQDRACISSHSNADRGAGKVSYLPASPGWAVIVSELGQGLRLVQVPGPILPRKIPGSWAVFGLGTWRRRTAFRRLKPCPVTEGFPGAPQATRSRSFNRLRYLRPQTTSPDLLRGGRIILRWGCCAGPLRSESR